MKSAGRILSLLVAATALTTGAAEAAILTTAGSTAYVDFGQGFKPVPPRTTVNPGDVISIEPGGRATLVYRNGCGFTVSPKRPVTVARVPPTCRGGPNPGNSRFDKIIGVTVMTTAFGTIAYKAVKMGNGPASP